MKLTTLAIALMGTSCASRSVMVNEEDYNRLCAEVFQSMKERTAKPILARAVSAGDFIGVNEEDDAALMRLYAILPGTLEKEWRRTLDGVNLKGTERCVISMGKQEQKTEIGETIQVAPYLIINGTSLEVLDGDAVVGRIRIDKIVLGKSGWKLLEIR